MKARLKVLPDKLRGGAWPSPVRAVRCPVKSGNDRDPHPLLLPALSWAHWGDRRRQGGGRSGPRQVSMPRIPRATRELQWQGQRVPTPKGEGNPETLPQLGSRAATRPREHGIPSNRASLSRGEYVPAPCTHRPSLHPSGVWVRRGPYGLRRT